jgi:hypothetical protein
MTRDSSSGRQQESLDLVPPEFTQRIKLPRGDEHRGGDSAALQKRPGMHEVVGVTVVERHADGPLGQRTARGAFGELGERQRLRNPPQHVQVFFEAVRMHRQQLRIRLQFHHAVIEQNGRTAKSAQSEPGRDTLPQPAGRSLHAPPPVLTARTAINS